jgi:glycosyltransferase involved in cell wall biosynthesis
MGDIMLAGKDKFKVLVTTLGRSHFVYATSALIAAGVDACLFQGWVVEHPDDSWILRLASKILKRGKSFVYGFSLRISTELEGRNIGDFFSEFVDTVGKYTFGRINEIWYNRACKLGFWLHGRRMARLLKKSDYSIVHIRSGFGRGGCIDMAKRKGMKVLVDHSAGAAQFIVEDVDGKKWGDWSFWWDVQRDCEAADILMVDCDFVKSTFIKYGYPEEKIRVVYMGLPLWFNGLKKWDENLDGIGRLPDKPLRIAYTGVFAAHKGCHEFLAAVEKLMDAGVFFEVDAMGSVAIPPDDLAEFPRAMRKINFRGHLPQPEMTEVLKEAHVFLFPSYSEGCARAAFEAMSMGLCVVCTYETGVPLVDGENGYLIKKRDADSIAERIRYLVDNPSRISVCGQAACNALKKYTWEFYAENVKEIYKELLSNG